MRTARDGGCSSTGMILSPAGALEAQREQRAAALTGG